MKMVSTSGNTSGMKDMKPMKKFKQDLKEWEDLKLESKQVYEC